MRKELMIDGKKLSDKSDTYIIAEMSANHLHNLDRAKRIIDVAKECGADAIKLQTYRPDTVSYTHLRAHET